jgi:hypothetical protein
MTARLRALASECTTFQESARSARFEALDAVAAVGAAVGAAENSDGLRAEIDARALHCDVVASGCFVSIDGALELPEDGAEETIRADVCARVEQALARARAVDLAFLRNVCTHAPLLAKPLEFLGGTSNQNSNAAAASAALVAAAARGDAELLKLLLTRSVADPRQHDGVEGVALLRAIESGCTEAVRVLLGDPRVDPRAQDSAALTRAVGLDCPEIVLALCLDPRVAAQHGDMVPVNYAIASDRADIVSLLLHKPAFAQLTTPQIHTLLFNCIAACTTHAVWRTVLARTQVRDLDAFVYVRLAAFEGAHEVLLDLHRDCGFRAFTANELERLSMSYRLRAPQTRPCSLASCPSVSPLLRNQANRGICFLYTVMRRQFVFEFFSDPCFLELLASVPVALTADAISAAWKRSDAAKALEDTPFGATKRAHDATMLQLPPALRADVEAWFVRDALQNSLTHMPLIFIIDMLGKMVRPRSEWIENARRLDALSRSVEVVSRAAFDAGAAWLKERFSRVIRILLTP